jgi:acyl-coenzyme A synthetase/AMP-(fatty) acid ligase
MTAVKKKPFDVLYKNIPALSGKVSRKEFTLSGYTYGDVFALAAGLRKTLSKTAGGKLICLGTANKAVTAASILAALTGACQLILPHSFSARALTEMSEATGFRYAIADRPEEMPVGVDILTPSPADPEEISPERLINPDKPFLRLFTGGSTGKPRVWSKSPRNLLTEAFYLKEKYELCESDLLVSTVPPYHIYGLLFSVLIPFASHACVLPDIYTFPQEIISTVNKHNASVLISVPIHYRALKVDNLSLPSLKAAFSSAGALDRSDGLYFYKKTGLGITEIYGSTETGGIASRCVSDKTERWKAFDIVSWKLTEGRLSVKSDFASPEMKRDQEGFCLTGDEAREEKENCFALLGRADGIVKVAGKRVDLLDVQNKIKTLPNIRDAYVTALPTDKGRVSDIAAVVACDMTETLLRKLIMDKLEPYAVPRRVKIVSSISRTATGKIDRRRVEKLFLNDK